MPKKKSATPKVSIDLPDADAMKKSFPKKASNQVKDVVINWPEELDTWHRPGRKVRKKKFTP